MENQQPHLKNKMFPVTKNRDISGGDEVNTVTNVDSVLSVNRWQYPNHLAQFTKLVSYLHCHLKVHLDRSLTTTNIWWMQYIWNNVNVCFHKHYWNRVEVEFTRMTSSKCLSQSNTTYLKFSIWKKTDFFSCLHLTTHVTAFSHTRLGDVYSVFT